MSLVRYGFHLATVQVFRLKSGGQAQRVELRNIAFIAPCQYSAAAQNGLMKCTNMLKGWELSDQIIDQADKIRPASGESPKEVLLTPS